MNLPSRAPSADGPPVASDSAPGAEFPVYSRLDLEIVRAFGCELEDAEGGRWLDLYGGHAVAQIGHGHPALLAAVEAQMRALVFQTNAVRVGVRARAHEALVRFAPAGLDRAFFINSGAEANENALRIACRVTGRGQVVTLRRGWHGRTAAAGAVTAGALGGWYAFPRTPFDVVTVPEEDLEALDEAIGPDTAALILEPVQGVAGAKDLSLEFLRAARGLCDERGALLIADEVQCGMGRSGTPFAIEAAGVLPDLLTTAKGLGGGLPVGAVLARAPWADALPKGALGTTFGGGPLACAAALTVIETLESPGFLARVREVSERIRATCRVGPVEAIHGRGLLLGLRCDRSAREVLAGLREHHILAGGSDDPRVVRLMPPLVLEDRHVEALAAALAALGSAPGGAGGAEA